MDNSYDTKHLKVLDGIRALAILIIVWYHFWQQNWISPTIGSFSIDYIPRYGYLLVDMMILISGFCLFIPYARAMVYKDKMPKMKDFYIKRIARIVPSYYLALIIFFIFWLLGRGIFNGFFFKDTIMHLLFVHNWSSDTLLYTCFNGVLWTVAIEVQFYLIFPFIAKMFTKKPIITYVIMMAMGIFCTWIIKSNVTSNNLSFYVNHFLTFIPVFANGILASWLYMLYTKKKKRNIITDLLFMIMSISCIMVYCYLVKHIGSENIQVWQLNNRILLSIVFTVFIISTLLSSRIYQKIFNNPFMKYICVISFNLYIYHQFIAVKLKEYRIPYYSGDIPPNMTGDTKWQWTYFILCIVISLIVASIITYFFEKPMANLLKKKFIKEKS